MSLPQAVPEFEALLEYLKYNCGCDLTGYKRSTLVRRLGQRMQSININSYQDYLQYLQSHDQEWMALLDTVLINVTSFFRDRDAWDYLASNIIPKIIASVQPDEPIRVWSAGCASGQEVYSLLMLFAEALGIEACLQRVQFYATDVDEAAIQQARQATYDSKAVASIPPDLLEKYFEPTPGGYVFDRQLRPNFVFGHHNLVEDAPMSKIDLLTCRNVLIYFTPETQASILVRFHFALKNTGFLFLGKSEALITHRQIFTPISLKHHVYTKGLNLDLNDHLLINPKSKKQALDATTHQVRIWQTAYETSFFAQLAVDYNGYLVSANERANLLFGLTLEDYHRPFEELELGKLVSSYVSLKKFYCSSRRITLKNIKWSGSKDTSYFDIYIVPVFRQKQHSLGVNLTFIDTGSSTSSPRG